jgi:Ca-activated chloride channel family protein
MLPKISTSLIHMLYSDLSCFFKNLISEYKPIILLLLTSQKGRNMLQGSYPSGKLGGIFIAILFLFPFAVTAQDDHKPLVKGNKSYQAGNFVEAEEEYLRAIEAAPNSVKGHYNRGNAIYKGIEGNEDPEVLKQRLDKAAESYLYAIENADDQLIKSQAYHNLGNAYMGQEELKKGVEAYKNALRLNPKDMDTKTNLQYALRQMQQQEEQQQGDGEGEGEPGESQEGEESDSPPKDGEGEQPPSEGKQEQDAKDQKDGGQSQEGKGEEQPTPEEMTKEEVLRQLKVMDDEEKKVQAKLKKEQRNEYSSDKDW